MMTDEQILKLAKICGFDEFPDDITATKEQLLKFSQKMYIKGYNNGKDEGYEEGWKSCDVSTKMNTMEFDDDD